MRKTALSLFGLCLLASTAVSQVGTGPGVITPDTDSKIFSITALSQISNFYINGATRQWIVQCSAAKVPGDGAGKYTWAMTVYGLHPRFGNTSQLTGGDFVVLGKFDETTGKYTPGTLAAKLNNISAGNFGLMLDGRLGLHAVLDHNDGVYYSKRASFTTAFPAPVKVQGITQTFVDPSIVDDGSGKLWIYYVDPDPNNSNLNRIIRQQLDASKFSSGVVKLAGTGQIVAVPVQSSTTLVVNVHSPTPIVDWTSGKDYGIYMSERVGNDSDQFIKTSLDPKQPQLLFVNTTRWLNNGAIAGGRMYYANSGANGGFYAAIHYADAAWLVGPDVAPGKSDIALGAVRDQNTGPNITVILLSGAPMAPIAIPGIQGKLGLSLAGLIALGTMTHTTADERGTFTLGVPADNRLSGLKLALQGVSVDPGASTMLTFTNTAWFNVK